MAAAIVFSGRTISFNVAEIGLAALPCALLAGLESLPGALLAGVLIGLGTSLCEGYLDQLTSGGVSTVFPFIMIVIVLIFLPNGLFGWKRIERL
jgi:branched-chain amino acid transport system permease protein